MIRIESLGSIWLIDEDLKRYMRMPRIEQPRYDDRPFLEDLTWYPFDSWSISACSHRAGRETLHIKPTSDRRGHICAPIAVHPHDNSREALRVADAGQPN